MQQLGFRHNRFIFLAPWTFAVLMQAAFGQTIPEAAKPNDLADLTLEQLLNVKVTSASLHEQSLKDVPGNVTVITAEEIARFGCRTLEDALSYVPGFFFTSDHTYTYLGVGGFALPGDYATRIIVMINGHNIAENVFDMSTWFGYDSPVDMDLVERIEVVRGSSSALYGSSGMLATINVVTKRPSESSGTGTRFETDSLGERKAEVTTSVPLRGGADLLLSMSVFNNAGAHQLYLPEFDSPLTNFGRAVDMDGSRGYHLFADFTWGRWELLGVAASDQRQVPISFGPTIFNDRGVRSEDSRRFAELSYTRDFYGDRSLSWGTSFDSYTYYGIYRYAGDDGGVIDNRERDGGNWIGSRLSYRMPDLFNGHLTVGTDAQLDLQAEVHVFNVAPVSGDVLLFNRPDRRVGIFAQQEWSVGKHWEINAGARFDWSYLKPDATSPRASLIYKPAGNTAVKLLFSRGFRDPSTFNMFYDDGISQIGNRLLRPETDHSYEINLDQRFLKRFRAQASLYRYDIANLIQDIYTPSGLAEYVNQGGARSLGGSLGVNARLSGDIQIDASLELQRTIFSNGRVLPNSPGQVGKVRASLPLWRNRLMIGLGIQALGQRRTLDGIPLPWVILPEAVVSTRPMPGGISFSAGVKNLSNAFYRDPAALNEVVDSMIGRGRAYYLNLSWHGLEKPADSGVKTASITKPR